jgi:hypothetical protein
LDDGPFQNGFESAKAEHVIDHGHVRLVEKPAVFRQFTGIMQFLVP